MPRLSGNLRASHVKYFLPSVCSMSSHMMSIGMSCSSNLDDTASTSFCRGFNSHISHLDSAIWDLNSPILDLNSPIWGLNSPIWDLNSPIWGLNSPIWDLNSSISDLNLSFGI